MGVGVRRLEAGRRINAGKLKTDEVEIEPPHDGVDFLQVVFPFLDVEQQIAAASQRIEIAELQRAPVGSFRG